MESNTNHFISIDQETRSHIPTANAAYYLNRKQQTLRSWASTESGPIRPLRLYGRLMWSVSDIRALLKGASI